jgi:hypothetical protein
MMLSAELYRQIIDALRSDPAGAAEKRAAPRVGLRAQVLVLLDGKTRVHLWCRNLSVGGIGLMHAHPLDAGTEFVVCLPASALSDPVCLSCIVVHCERKSERFLIGARIVRTLSSEEAASLGVNNAA